jgi:ribosome maturation factor RimP
MSRLNREAIGGIIERVVAREQLELVHWEIAGPPGRFVLRIFIDRPGGVSHAHCEAVSNEVGLLLDVEDLIPHRYTLEVSSPGIERGLYKASDYSRFAGARIRLRTAQPINGQRNFSGALLGIEGDKVKLEADGVGPIEIVLENIVKANIEYKY